MRQPKYPLKNHKLFKKPVNNYNLYFDKKDHLETEVK